MFHVYFLQHVAKPEGKTLLYVKEMYDILFGQPTHRMKENLQAGIKEILCVDSWIKFFDHINVPLPTTTQLHSWLCGSVLRSEQKRYHFRDGFKKTKKSNNKSTKPKHPSLHHDPDDHFY